MNSQVGVFRGVGLGSVHCARHAVELHFVATPLSLLYFKEPHWCVVEKKGTDRRRKDRKREHISLSSQLSVSSGGLQAQY